MVGDEWGQGGGDCIFPAASTEMLVGRPVVMIDAPK